MTEPASKKNKAPLSGKAICISGTLSVSRKTFEATLLGAGASLSGSASRSTTYLVCTASEIAAQTSKVRQAAKNGVPCVSEKFLRDFIDQGKVGDVTSDPVNMAAAAANGDGGVAAGGVSGGGGGGGGGAALTMTPHGRATSVAKAKAVMLAKAWPDGSDPTDWWISEKLDGVRAYWDGRDFYSRNGNPFPVRLRGTGFLAPPLLSLLPLFPFSPAPALASIDRHSGALPGPGLVSPGQVPDWFKEGLPTDEPLDGELWCGRQKFRQALSIIKSSGSGKQWEFVSYLVFDAPERKAETYEQRVAWIAANVRYKDNTPWAKAVRHTASARA